MFVNRADFGFDPELHQSVSCRRVPGPPPPDFDEVGDRPRSARANGAADGDPLVHQGRQGDAPTVASVPDPVGIRNADVGEVDLVEFSLARDLSERANLDARSVHVEHEIGEAPVLGEIGIAAGDEHPPTREVGHGRPHLLPVDDPFLTVSDGSSSQTGDVRAGPRLAEELAPYLRTREHRSQPPHLLGLGSVRDDHRSAHAMAQNVHWPRSM